MLTLLIVATSPRHPFTAGVGPGVTVVPVSEDPRPPSVVRTRGGLHRNTGWRRLTQQFWAMLVKKGLFHARNGVITAVQVIRDLSMWSSPPPRSLGTCQCGHYCRQMLIRNLSMRSLLPSQVIRNCELSHRRRPCN